MLKAVQILVYFVYDLVVTLRLEYCFVINDNKVR